MKLDSKLVSIYKKDLDQSLLGCYVVRDHNTNEKLNKPIHKNTINSILTNNSIHIRNSRETFSVILFDYGEWVKAVDQSGITTYDTTISIIRYKNGIKNDVCTEHVRLEVKEIVTNKKQESLKGSDRGSDLAVIHEDILKNINNDIKYGSSISNAEKRNVVCESLSGHADWSNRAIARECGVSHKTVARCKKEMHK